MLAEAGTYCWGITRKMVLHSRLQEGSSPYGDEANNGTVFVIRENETVRGFRLEVSLRADSSGILKLIARLRNITPFEDS